jgi:hypothetical protein
MDIAGLFLSPARGLLNVLSEADPGAFEGCCGPARVICRHIEQRVVALMVAF